MFIWKIVIYQQIRRIGGKFRNEFSKGKTFLTLGCDKFKIKFLKDNDPTCVLPANDPLTQQESHGVGIGHNFGGTCKDTMTKFFEQRT